MTQTIDFTPAKPITDDAAARIGRKLAMMIQEATGDGDPVCVQLQYVLDVVGKQIGWRFVVDAGVVARERVAELVEEARR